MENASHLFRSENFSQTFDLTKGIGYGLIYQTIIGSSSTNPFTKQVFFINRRKLSRRFFGIK